MSYNKAKMLLLLIGGVCILRRSAAEGQMSRDFYPTSRAPSDGSLWQCLVAGIVWMVLSLRLADTAVLEEGEAGCNPWCGSQEGEM